MVTHCLKKMKILHLTPHLGGGVGEVIRSYLKYAQKDEEIKHSIAVLEDINIESKKILKEINIDFFEHAYQDKEILDALIKDQDIVLIHWWNHPLLQEFIMNSTLPPNRSVIWSHISGNQAPNVFNPFILQYPDTFIFTTPLSSTQPSVISSKTQTNTKTIWSTVGSELLYSKYKDLINHSEKKSNAIGYIGNLDSTKLSPKIDDILKHKKLVEKKFVFVGPSTEHFINLISRHSKIDIKVTNYVPEDVKFEYLNDFSIFAYPLAMEHYGTCDQALQEAMVFKKPIVAFTNPMESHMIRHRITGLLADDVNSYVDMAMELLTDQKISIQLGEAAHEYALENFSMKSMYESWKSVFEQLIDVPKSAKNSLSV